MLNDSYICTQNLALEVDKWREGKPIDGLINNAALGSGSVGKYIADRTAETSSLPGGASTVVFLPQQELEDETLMRVNALGPKWVTEALLPAMMRKSGEGSSLWRSVVLFVGSVGASEVHKGTFSFPFFGKLYSPHTITATPFH